MLFIVGRKIRPRSFNSGMFDTNLNPTEYWSCYRCGKVRTVYDWRRAQYLDEQTDEEIDELLGTYSDEQLQSVPGEYLLPSRWGFIQFDYEYRRGGGSYKMNMLLCDECIEEAKDD